MNAIKTRRTMNSKTTGLVVVFPAIIAVLRGCEADAANIAEERAARNNSPCNASVIQKASLDEIQTAILLSLTTNDWIIREQSEGKISAELWDDGASKRVSIAYDDESISIENLSTDNAGQHQTPARAIQNLMNDVQRNLLAGVFDMTQTRPSPNPERLHDDSAQAKAWKDALGEY